MRGLSDIPLARHERDIGDAPGDARIHAISLIEVRIRRNILKAGFKESCVRENYEPV